MEKINSILTLEMTFRKKTKTKSCFSTSYSLILAAELLNKDNEVTDTKLIRQVFSVKITAQVKEIFSPSNIIFYNKYVMI